MSCNKEESGILKNADPMKAPDAGIIALSIFIGLGVVGMIVSTYIPSLKEVIILLVALIFLAMSIWYLIYSIQLYKNSIKDKDKSILAKSYDRLLTAIGN
jgi:protein-S-isoprenylcysteine O-methyltransferase Ste14